MINRRELIQRASILIGAALTPSVSTAVLAGASANKLPSLSRLPDPHKATISVLSELIIPATDTPGAIAAGVPNFVNLIFSDWYTAQERDSFLDGLTRLDKLCLKIYGAHLIDLPIQQQTAILTICSEINAATAHELHPFFLSIRELTVLGYYTSEVGAKQELIYNPVPMRYKGDYLYADVNKQWSY